MYATLISSGRAGLGDPDKTESTPRGTFMIYQKEVASTMDGDEDKCLNCKDRPVDPKHDPYCSTRCAAEAEHVGGYGR